MGYLINTLLSGLHFMLLLFFNYCLFINSESYFSDIVRLESFEPPEENHNENTLYKDWATKSTLGIDILFMFSL